VHAQQILPHTTLQDAATWQIQWCDPRATAVAFYSESFIMTSVTVSMQCC